MEWLKKHTDTVIVLGGILGSVFWMNGKFNEVDERINDLKNEISTIKTILILKGIMPESFAYEKGEK
jgi:hypothetical protein